MMGFLLPSFAPYSKQRSKLQFEIYVYQFRKETGVSISMYINLFMIDFQVNKGLSVYKTCLLISLLSNLPIQYRLLSRILLCSKSFPNTNSHKKRLMDISPTDRQATGMTNLIKPMQMRLLVVLCACFYSIAVSDGSKNQCLHSVILRIVNTSGIYYIWRGMPNSDGMPISANAECRRHWAAGIRQH